MIKKTFLHTGENLIARVTFRLPGEMWANGIHLVGDFNLWNHTSHPLQINREGVWTITVDLEANHFYQFRYLYDGTWINDNAAHAYVRNRYGSDNFVVVTDPSWQKHCDERRSEAHPSKVHQ